LFSCIWSAIDGIDDDDGGGEGGGDGDGGGKGGDGGGGYGGIWSGASMFPQHSLILYKLLIDSHVYKCKCVGSLNPGNVVEVGWSQHFAVLYTYFRDVQDFMWK